MGLVDEVVEEVSGSDLLEPHNGRDVHVGLGIRFLSLIEYSHLFGVHDLCGTRSTWSCLFLLGSSSSETATLKSSHTAPRIGHETPRPSWGLTAEVGIVAAARAGVDPSGL